MNHLDLFSGIGGFALAAQWAGIETAQFVEIDPFCQRILTKNFPTIPIHSDIKTFEPKQKFDLITGGFPCQGFSIAGKRKGILDDRYLWPEMLRIIHQCNPAWVVAENVVGLVNLALDSIITDLENEGYAVQVYIIPACAANAPHRRDRLWIIAHFNGKRCNERGDPGQKRRVQSDKIWDIAPLQSKRAQFQPFSWQTYKAQDWFDYNARTSRANNGISGGVDRVKALGNAIVPQVVYPILKFICDF